MIIEKNNGKWIVSEIIDGYLFKKIFIFCTKAEAIGRFKTEKKMLEEVK